MRNQHKAAAASLNNSGEVPGKVTLEQLKKGQEGIICFVPDHPVLPPLGFRPGKKVRLCCLESFGGPVIAEIEKRSIALGRSLAREIQVICGEAEAHALQ